MMPITVPDGSGADESTKLSSFGLVKTLNFMAMAQPVRSEWQQDVIERVRAELAGMVESERRWMLDEFLLSFWAELHDELCNAINRSYTVALADVRADLNSLRESIKKIAGNGGIIDLPTLLSMRGSRSISRPWV